MINVNLLTAEEVRALAQLNSMGGRTLIGLLEKLAKEAREDLVTADTDVIMRRTQGRAGGFDDLLKAVDDAATVLARTK